MFRFATGDYFFILFITNCKKKKKIHCTFQLKIEVDYGKVMKKQSLVAALLCFHLKNLVELLQKT